MGFDIALMCCSGLEAALDYKVGFGKTGFDVAMAVFEAVHDIGRHAIRHSLVGPALMQHRRAGLHRLVDVGDMG